MRRVGISFGGQLSFLSELVTSAGDSLVAGPVAVSGDGLHIYMIHPSDAVSALAPRAWLQIFTPSLVDIVFAVVCFLDIATHLNRK